MTVVNPKSISGINSITTGSGSDNLLTIHTSDASSTERVRINSSGDVIVGSGITVSPDGDIFATGVTTSTTFVGNLTGNVTGNINGDLTGTLQTAAQTNITSVGSLSSLVVTGGITATGGNIVMNDSSGSSANRIKLGTSQDLSIYHDGSHSRIDETGTGNLMIQSDNAVYIKKGTSENIAVFNADGAVDLYHDNTKRLATTGNGADVFGSGTSNNYFKLINTSGTSNASHHMTIDTYNAANSYWNDLKIDASNIQLNTYTANRATLSNTSLTFASGVDISMASGNGISFGATGNGSGTMTSELFDDYEEGTWTPTTPSGGGGWASVSSAMYRKVGNIVFLSFYGGLASQSSTNALKIGGFPYAAAGSSHYSYLYGRVEGYTDSQGFWQAGAGTDAATFFYNNGLIGYNNFSANAYVLLSGFYFTG